MKQTAMQILIEWGDKMMLEHPMKILSFAEAIDKAEQLLEIEKEQIIEAYKYGNQSDVYFKPEQYYNETYGK
jgi:hypothetical protein